MFVVGALTKSTEPASSLDSVRDEDLCHLTVVVIGSWPKISAIQEGRSLLFIP